MNLQNGNLKNNKHFGIYVHIPFCDSKCVYCNFVSQVACDEIKEKYFKALKKEICDDAFNLLTQNAKTKKIVNSIYFGGGTPSAVDEKFICEILLLLKEKFDVAENAEITIECNPCSSNLAKLRAFKDVGFSRLSFGAQSFFDDELAFLGRRHSGEDIEKAVKMAKSAGFENISLDLIVGAKKYNGKDFEYIKSKIEKFKNNGVKHFSVYILTVEENTLLHQKIQSGDAILPNDDEILYMFEKIGEILKSFSYEKYEVSNFCLKDYQSKHNLNYWNLGEYIGYGVSAHSFLNGQRFYLTENVNEYLKISSNKFSKKLYQIEFLSEKQQDFEKIMLGLRQPNGVNFKDVQTFDLKEKVNKNIFLKQENLINFNENRVWATQKGFSLLNQIILTLTD